MIIDIYTHLAPRSFLDRMVVLAPKLGNIVNRLLAVKPLSDLDVRFRDMDTVPDYRQLISLPNPSLEEIGPADTGRELARIANDELAELCVKYPDRFIGFAASVYLDDVDSAIAEADRAIHQLGAKGVLTTTMWRAIRWTRNAFALSSPPWRNGSARSGCTPAARPM